MAVTRFLRELEIHLLEGQNSAAVDLFDVRHAEKVLRAFGRAFGVLPERTSETTNDQKQFLEQAVQGLAQEDKVVCVRLALFAEMMKGKPWTPAKLKEVGGTEGIGVTFLEETFAATTAPPDHRFHQKAARGVLKALLPEQGTDIKGHMRSRQELLEASGYGDRQKEFDDLIRILDGESPAHHSDRPGRHRLRFAEHRRRGRSKVLPTDPRLSGAFLAGVADPANKRETRRGRAELRLADRAALWKVKRENRHLPSLWEFLNIRLLTDKKKWTEPQQKMMSKAGRFHGIRSGVAAAVAIVALFSAWEINGRFQASRARQTTRRRRHHRSARHCPGIERLPSLGRPDAPGAVRPGPKGFQSEAAFGSGAPACGSKPDCRLAGRLAAWCRRARLPWCGTLCRPTRTV